MAVSRPWSMRDLCRVRARLWDKPFLSQEMTNLPKLLGEGSLEVEEEPYATLSKDNDVPMEVKDLLDDSDTLAT
ncbi:hypothetical protein BHM03_00001175 [Ensete ventricosum]|nr:hypothetical protein BHM03_00001175 [Ensete ventricosum]